MRLAPLTLVMAALVLAAACKTARTSRAAAISADALENEEQLPACDDITVGRVYWVRSLNQSMECAEGGTWKPRELNPEGKDADGFAPRSIPDQD